MLLCCTPLSPWLATFWLTLPGSERQCLEWVLWSHPRILIWLATSQPTIPGVESIWGTLFMITVTAYLLTSLFFSWHCQDLKERNESGCFESVHLISIAQLFFQHTYPQRGQGAEGGCCDMAHYLPTINCFSAKTSEIESRCWEFLLRASATPAPAISICS